MTENIDNNFEDLSFSQLVEMSNFELEDETPNNEEVEITLENKEEKEEVKEEAKLEPPVLEKETEITLAPQASIYSELAKEKLASGEWEDVLVEIDGEEKKLSELTNVDKETYQGILESFKAEQDDKLKSNYVSVKDLNDTQKALINIIKTGDLDKAKELFDNPQQLQEPFQGYDNDNDTHNEQVLGWYYRQQGHSEKEVSVLLQAAKEDLTLDTKASRIVEFQKNQFHENIKNQEQAVQKEKLAEQEKIKSYRKDLMTEFKSEEMTEGIAKKFVDVATKYNQDGDLEIDTIYDEWMSDPKKAKELIYFMLDKDGYLKKATNETKRATHQEVLKKVHILRDTTKTTKQKEEDTAPKGNNPFEGLEFD